MKLYHMLVTGTFLGVCTYTDLKYRVIYRKVVTIAAGLIFLGYVVNWINGQWAETNQPSEFVLSVLPGLGCILLSFLTRESLGYGDGIVIIVCGLCMGFADTVEWLVLGFFLSAIWAVYLCVFRKADRRKEFPFLPFLLGAFVIEMIFSYLGKR